MLVAMSASTHSLCPSNEDIPHDKGKACSAVRATHATPAPHRCVVSSLPRRDECQQPHPVFLMLPDEGKPCTWGLLCQSLTAKRCPSVAALAARRTAHSAPVRCQSIACNECQQSQPASCQQPLPASLCRGQNVKCYSRISITF